VPGSPLTGQAITIAVSVSGPVTGGDAVTPTGSVTITDGGSNYCVASLALASAGVATGSCQITETAAATYDLTAGYSGDATFAASSATGTTAVTVASNAATVSINSATPADPVVGQPITADVTVTAPPVEEGAYTPTGTVTISDGATQQCPASLTESSAGVATGSCQFTEGSPGVYGFIASYPGDGNFPSSATDAATTVTVAKDTPTVSVTASITKPTIGQSVTLRATVTGYSTGSGAPAPTGKVTLRVNKQVCSGSTASSANGVLVATCKLGIDVPGPGSLVASYAGNSSFNAASSTLSRLTVVPVTTTTKITLSTHEVAAGQEQHERISVAVAPKYPGPSLAGVKVVVMEGTKALCKVTLAGNGKGTCTFAKSALPKGTYEVFGDLARTPSFLASKSPPVKLVVQS
jgi:large repetitive protein